MFLKELKHSILLFLIPLLLFSACKKEDDGNAAKENKAPASQEDSNSSKPGNKEGPATSLSLEGDRTVPAGSCAGPYQLKAFDVSGGPSAPLASATLKFSEETAKYVFLEERCPTGSNVSEVSVSASGNKAKFYFKREAAGDFTLSASIGDLKTSLTVHVNPLSASLIKLEGSQSFASDQCIHFQVKTFDVFSNDSSVAALTEVQLKFSQSSASFAFYADATCLSPTATISIPQGLNFASVYVQLPQGEYNVRGEATGFQSRELEVEVLPGQSPLLSLIAPPENITAGGCASLRANFLTHERKPAILRATAILKTRSSVSTDRFFSDGNCATEIGVNGLSVNEGPAGVDLYFKGTTVGQQNGDRTLTTSMEGYVNASQTVTLIAAEATTLSLTDVPESEVRAETCAGPIVVRSFDIYGNPSVLSSPYVLNLGSKGDAGGGWFGQGCVGEPLQTAQMGTIGFHPLYFKGANPGALILTVSNEVLSSTSTSLTISNRRGGTFNLLASTPESTVPVGTCSPLFVFTKDGNGFPVDMESRLVLEPSSEMNESIRFYTDSDCQSPMSIESPVAIPQGENKARIYFQATHSRDGAREGILHVKANVSDTRYDANSTGVQFTPGIPEHLVMDLPNSIPGFSCAALTVKLRDYYENPTTSLEPVSIRFSTLLPALTGEIPESPPYFQDSDCRNPISALEIPANRESLVFFVKPTVPPTLKFQVSPGEAHPGIRGIISPPIALTEPIPLRLVFPGPGETEAGRCTTYSAQLLNSESKSEAREESYVSLSSTSNEPVVFFEDGMCQTKLDPTRVSIGPTKNPAPIYFMATRATPPEGEPLFLYVNTLDLSVSKEVRITPSIPGRLAHSGSGSSYLVNEKCTGPYYILIQDRFENATKVESQIPLAFENKATLNPGVAGTFSDTGCENSSIAVPSGSTYSSYYLKGTSLGNVALEVKVQGQDITPDSRGFTVVEDSVVFVAASSASESGQKLERLSLINLGTVELGQKSSVRTFYLHNPSSGFYATKIKLGNLTSPFLYSSSEGDCPLQREFYLSPNGLCSVNLQVLANQVGQKSSTLTIESESATGAQTLQVALSALGVDTSAAQLVFSSSALEFGNSTSTGTPITKVIRLKNEGNRQASGISLSEDGESFAIESGADSCTTLEPKNSCEITLKYVPSPEDADAKGSLVANYVTRPDVLGSATLSLHGSFSEPARLVTSRERIDFGEVLVGLTSPVEPITLRNEGGVAAQVTLESFPDGFTLSENLCNGELSPGASCGFSVSFSPIRRGNYDPTLTINYNGGPLSIPVTGSAATAAKLKFDLSSLSFGDTVQGGTATLGLLVTNDGGKNATGIVIPSLGSSPFSVSAGACGTTIAAGTSCFMNVTYSPAATDLGPKGDEFSLYFQNGAALVSSSAVSLSGTAVVLPAPNLSSLTLNADFSFSGAFTVGARGTTGLEVWIKQGTGTYTKKQPNFSGDTFTYSVPSRGVTYYVKLRNLLGTKPSGYSGELSLFVPAAPTLSSFSPAALKKGATLTINGTKFTGATRVQINGVDASFSFVSDARLTAVVPMDAATGKVSVTAPGGSIDSAASVTIYEIPTISVLAPTSGARGSSVVISGTNFKLGTQNLVTALTIGGVSMSRTVNSDTQITATIPSSANTGKITLTTLGGSTTSENDFTIYLAPTVTAFEPVSAPVGATIKIKGTNLTNLIGVKFNSGKEAVTFNTVSGTEATVVVPEGAITGTVVTTTKGGSYSRSFTVIQPPAISTFTAAGKAGTVITVNGSNLAAATAALNGSTLTLTSNTNTYLKFAIPANATTGKITVTTSAGSVETATDLTVYQKPTISEFTPDKGAAGTVVTITGTNLNTASVVSLNGKALSAVHVTSDTQIEATLPTGATAGPFIVTTKWGKSDPSTATFYPAPTITTFTSSGIRGATVTINGTNFTGLSEVKFNDVTASFTYVSTTRATAIVPSTATTGKISVTATGGNAVSATNFTVK